MATAQTINEPTVPGVMITTSMNCACNLTTSEHRLQLGVAASRAEGMIYLCPFVYVPTTEDKSRNLKPEN